MTRIGLMLGFKLLVVLFSYLLVSVKITHLIDQAHSLSLKCNNIIKSFIFTKSQNKYLFGLCTDTSIL